jgi:phosphate transport system substrate-binding protein
VASVRNQAGNFVEPSAESTAAAIDASQAELAKDVRTPIVDPPAASKDAYPISGLTFLLVRKQGKNPAKEQSVKDFVQFIITQGQNSAEGLQYAKLPLSLEQQDQKLLSEIGTGQQTSSNQVQSQ